MDNERFQKAISYSQLAADKDRDGEFEEALEMYKIALENWNFLQKYQTNAALKEKFKQKMEQLITRAEQLKIYLEKQHAEAALKAPVAGVKKATKKQAVQKEDKEEDKLKSKLDGAIVEEKPNVHWSDIAGLETAKANLQEAVILPTRFPSLFTGDRQPWKGILLYGPPGTGKTYLAKACATESAGTFLSVSSADLLSKWQGESEKLVRTLFEMARAKQPSIIFIDEVDSLCSARAEGENESSRRVKTEFLVQMQGIGKSSLGVLVLGATNVPWELDSAVRRRFERRVYIPLPDAEGRQQMFKLALKNTPHKLTDDEFKDLAQRTDGFSGSDISIVVRDALFQPVRLCQTATTFKRVKKDGTIYWTPCDPNDGDSSKTSMRMMDVDSDKLLPPDLTLKDFMDVLKTSRASVGVADIQRHIEWTKMFGLEGS